MLSWSISRTDAAPTPTATARARMSGASRSRWAGGQGLRVADAGDPVAARPHDHGRRDDGATGRRDADLVDADDPLEALVPETALVAEGGDDRSHRAASVPESNDPAGSAGSEVAVGRRAAGRQPLVRRSRRVAALPTRSRRKYSWARRATPWRTTSIFSMRGLLILNVRSTPTPRGDAADGDRAGDAAAAQAHDGPLEDLDALAVALDDLGRHLDGVAGRELRQVGAKLVLDDLVEHGHGAVPDSSGQPWLRVGVRERRGRASAAEYSTASRRALGRRRRSGPAAGPAGGAGPLERLLRAPARDGAVVARGQDRRHVQPAERRRPRVLRVLEQAVGERFLDGRGVVDRARAGGG